MRVADVATFGFAVVLQSADLTEVMFAPAAGERIKKKTKQTRRLMTSCADAAAKTLLLCHNGVFEGLLADEALEGQVLLVAAHLVVLVI